MHRRFTHRLQGNMSRQISALLSSGNPHKSLLIKLCSLSVKMSCIWPMIHPPHYHMMTCSLHLVLCALTATHILTNIATFHMYVCLKIVLICVFLLILEKRVCFTNACMVWYFCLWMSDKMLLINLEFWQATWKQCRHKTAAVLPMLMWRSST